MRARWNRNLGYREIGLSYFVLSGEYWRLSISFWFGSLVLSNFKGQTKPTYEDKRANRCELN